MEVKFVITKVKHEIYLKQNTEFVGLLDTQVTKGNFLQFAFPHRNMVAEIQYIAILQMPQNVLAAEIKKIRLSDPFWTSKYGIPAICSLPVCMIYKTSVKNWPTSDEIIFRNSKSLRMEFLIVFWKTKNWPESKSPLPVERQIQIQKMEIKPLWFAFIPLLFSIIETAHTETHESLEGSNENKESNYLTVRLTE